MILLFGLLGLIWCVRLFVEKGMDGLTVNNFNFVMLMLGLVLCGAPRSSPRPASPPFPLPGVSSSSSPLYAGIFGSVVNTGLSEVISNAFMTISSTKTFPEAAYIYSAVLNMAVPKLLLALAVAGLALNLSVKRP